jgi:hypothetical protein
MGPICALFKSAHHTLSENWRRGRARAVTMEPQVEGVGCDPKSSSREQALFSLFPAIVFTLRTPLPDHRLRATYVSVPVLTPSLTHSTQWLPSPVQRYRPAPRRAVPATPEPRPAIWGPQPTIPATSSSLVRLVEDVLRERFRQNWCKRWCKLAHRLT